MKLTLTTEERKAIFRGDHRALKRPSKPDVKGGDNHILSWTRGGRQIVDRSTGATIDIPRKPAVWIELKEPALKEGIWVIQFIAHDDRQPLRLLGSTPGPAGEAGLKTRWRNPLQVPRVGERTESWSLESERGYTGSGRAAIDPAEGVDDESLRTFSARARINLAEHREGERAERQQGAQGKKLMRRLRRLQGEAEIQGVDFSERLLPILRQLESEIGDARVARVS